MHAQFSKRVCGQFRYVTLHEIIAWTAIYYPYSNNVVQLLFAACVACCFGQQWPICISDCCMLTVMMQNQALDTGKRCCHHFYKDLQETFCTGATMVRGAVTRCSPIQKLPCLQFPCFWQRQKPMARYVTMLRVCGPGIK